MANAVVGDYGDLITIETGQDLTSATNLKVYVTKPDGTQIVKTSVEGVAYTATPTDGKIEYRIESGLLDMDGEFKFSGYFEISGVGHYSQATPSEYEVKRRNQTP